MLRGVPVVVMAVLLASSWALPAHSEEKVVEYHLAIAGQEVNMTGEPSRGMTINGGIPGPTLRFTEGDTARIHVLNRMDVDTSIHWHGILVPPGMDGVPDISFPPIRPNTTFTYTFPIRQSGTYWYHSHTRLQEQSGVYGSIVIEPREKRIQADREHVIVLSDWTDEKPSLVLRNLKRGSEWYAIQKGAGQSILGAAKAGRLGDYFKRELQRMPPMDISDVAYDRFLANGKPQSVLDAKPGETVRLRIINGSATTFFFLDFAGGPMTVIAADGIDVEPVELDRLLIGVAETYDVLVRIPDSDSYELRATAHDGSSYASVRLGSGPKHTAPDVPRPDLYHSMGDPSLGKILSLTPDGVMGMPDRAVQEGKFDKPGMMDMGGMHMEKGHDMKSGEGHALASTMEHPSLSKDGMGHMSHPGSTDMPGPGSGKAYSRNFRPLASDVALSPNRAVDGMDPRRPWPPYDKLRAIRPTAFDKSKPVREIRLTLDGDMERYVWFLNNKPLSEKDDILIRQGEVVRFIMINRTMMHHPMHLHGHFFRVINGQDDYAPLKHTVDVAPMSTTVIEFNAEEVGDWFFHCHLLYHMMAGMARMVHYEGFSPPEDVLALRPNLYKDSWYAWARADVLSNMTEGYVRLSNTRNMVNAEWEVGWQKVESTDWESIVTWDYSLDRFTSFFGGADLLGGGSELDKIRGVMGLRYLLPLGIESRTWLDTDLGARVALEKEWALTPRLAIFGEVEYDTHDYWEGASGLHYLINGAFSIVGKWHSEYGWGGGLQIRF